MLHAAVLSESTIFMQKQEENKNTGIRVLFEGNGLQRRDQQMEALPMVRAISSVQCVRGINSSGKDRRKKLPG
jgi:hypothetical protein